VDEFSGRVLPGRRCDGHQELLEERTGRDSTGNSDFGDNYLSKHVLAVSVAGMTGLQDGRSGV